MMGVAEKASKSYDHERLEHPVSPTNPATVPTFPCRPFLIDGQFEGEMKAHVIEKESTSGLRCTYIFYTIAYTDG